MIYMKFNMLILSGKEVYVVTGLAIVGAACIVKTAFDGVCKVTEFVQNKLSEDDEEEESV